MDESVYSVIAYIARYWFAGLVVLIFWRALKWVRKDADQSARIRSRLPDAGFVGEWAVLEAGDGELQAGMTISAPRDGWLGSARGCDVRLKSRDVPARAARFYFRKDGLHLLPRRAGDVTVDGEPVRREAVLRHGALLAVGDVTLQLRLFAGVLLAGETPAGRKRRGREDSGGAAVFQTTDRPGASLPRPSLRIKKQR